MISAQDPDEAAAYNLILNNIEPIQIHPNGNKIFLKSQDDSHYLKLRILKQGVYLVRAESERYPVIIRVYNLPNMQSIEQKTAAAYPLTPGDYLIVLSGKGGESIQVSVNP